MNTTYCGAAVLVLFASQYCKFLKESYYKCVFLGFSWRKWSGFYDKQK